MQQDVRYCTTEDGVRIAYCAEGEGLPLFLVHYVYAFSLSHLVPQFHHAIQRIGRGRRLIRYDMRGTGLSQREVEDVTPAAMIKDIEAVADEIELGEFVMLGAASGGGRAIQYAAGHPDRVSALILYEAYPKLAEIFPPELIRAFALLARANWPNATRTLTDIATRTRDEEEQGQWMDLVFESTTGDTMARILEAHVDMDVTDALPSVGCPTLVVHSRNDMQWPFALGRRLAEGIPKARLVPLDGDSGGAFTDPAAALDAIDSFLAEQASTIAPILEGPIGIVGKPLTAREAEIIRLIAAGLTSKDISQRLSLSIRTVGRHITNIYDKIGARSRADATAYALRHGLTAE
jgi:pimeloyl-ACP methyl ester carboxylesterase/DNA-binding CsgD family transcriptional regulator